MPVLFRYKGFRFLLYSNEGNPREPIHIHVVKDGIDAKFWLDPVRLAYNDGFNAQVLRELMEVAEANAERMQYRISTRGLHWEALDEDISLAGLLAGYGDMTRRPAQAA